MTRLRIAFLIAAVVGLVTACGDDSAKDGLSSFQDETDRGRPSRPDLSQPDAGATDTGLDAPMADTGLADLSASDTGANDTGTDAWDADAPGEDTGPDVPDDEPLEPGLLGYIGSACQSAADCPFEGATCIEDDEGYPLGMCTTGCDRICPDREGFPTTFCIDTDTAGAACHSRCDFTVYPGRGCRDGYACVETPRSGEPGTMVGTCVRGDGDLMLSECLQWLVDHDVAFEPTTYAPRSPEGRPDLTCALEDPIRLHSPLNGIELRYYYDEPGDFRSLLMSCHLARAMYEATDILHEYEIVEIVHIGTTVCRTTSFGSLSQHALGLAIDYAGFFDDNANWYGVEDHWEHDTSNPVSAAARLLYDTAYTWFDEWIFDTILTPNYNDAHDNHFHLDLTPGAHFIGVLGPDAGPHIGVNPGGE